jgi:hypothetical protein
MNLSIPGLDLFDDAISDGFAAARPDELMPASVTITDFTDCPTERPSRI